MRRIVNVTTPPPSNGTAPPSERAWWQGCRSREFSARIQAMTIAELERLKIELAGALTLIQAQVETRNGENDDEWYQRARHARGHISRLLATVKVVLTTRAHDRHSEKEGRKAEHVTTARGRLASGDIAGAVTTILDLLEGEGRKK